MVQSNPIQIKFNVDDKQYEKLEKLADDRYISVPQFCKLTSLQVRVSPARPIEIKEKLKAEDMDFLKDIIKRYDTNRQFFKYDKEFNQRLFNFALKHLSESL